MRGNHVYDMLPIRWRREPGITEYILCTFQVLASPQTLNKWRKNDLVFFVYSLEDNKWRLDTRTLSNLKAPHLLATVQKCQLK